MELPTGSLPFNVSDFMELHMHKVLNDMQQKFVYIASIMEVEAAANGSITHSRATKMLNEEKVAADSLCKEWRHISRRKSTMADDLRDHTEHKQVNYELATATLARILATQTKWLAKSSNKAEKFVARKFKKRCVAYYDAEEPLKNGEGLFCQVTGLYLNKRLTKAVRLIPRFLGSWETAYLYGNDVLEAEEPTNSLMLYYAVEKALDTGRLVIVPIEDPTFRALGTRWRCIVTDPAYMKNLVGGLRIRFKDLDGKELVFPYRNRPAKRYLYFRYIMSCMMSGYYRKEGWMGRHDVTRSTVWANPGPWLRESVIKELVAQVGEIFLPENIAKATFEDGKGPDFRIVPEYQRKGDAISTAHLIRKSCVDFMETCVEKQESGVSDDEEDDDDDEDSDDEDDDDERFEDWR